MKAIFTFVTLLGLATATTVLKAQQTPTPGNGDQTTAQERDRMRTPGSEPSGVPQQDRDTIQKRDRTRTPGSEPSGMPRQDRDTMQKRDRIHTPGTGTGQPGSRPGGQNPGSSGPRGGGRRR
jgi:hypothetical protein